jgi:uncharacterized protein YkwD
VAFGSGLAGCGSREQRIPAESPGATEVERRIFALVNDERKNRNLQRLVWNDQLLPASREHSRRMAERNYFSHQDPEYGDLPQRLMRFGIRYSAAGENLFLASGVAEFAEHAVTSWLKSSGHRENMLNPAFRSSAAGLYRTRDGTVYATQIFTAP